MVYAIILGTIICCLILVSSVERRMRERAPDPTPRTTLIPPVTTTPRAP